MFCFCLWVLDGWFGFLGVLLGVLLLVGFGVDYVVGFCCRLLLFVLCWGDFAGIGFCFVRFRYVFGLSTLGMCCLRGLLFVTCDFLDRVADGRFLVQILML